MGISKFVYLLLLVVLIGCSNDKNAADPTATNNSFNSFRERFIDVYWQNNPAYAIYAGYGKYHDKLKVPDSTSLANDIRLCRRYLDSLKSFQYDELTPGNKVSYRIMDIEFRRTIWYIDTLKNQQWDPSVYNIGWESYELISRPFAPLDKRLQILSSYIKDAEAYYKAALSIIHEPTKEHTALAITQNQGSVSVFSQVLKDSIAASTLSKGEKDSLNARADISIKAINEFVDSLKRMLNNNNIVFSDYRIGEQLFNQKFRYDLATDYSAKEIFDKAIAVRNGYYNGMIKIANELWPKYYGNAARPADSMALIKAVLDKISLQHTTPALLNDTLKQHLYNIKSFIVQKGLFDFDTTAPIEVRQMPPFAMGVTVASANFPAIYEKQSVSYYNINDLTVLQPKESENILREYNNYTLQLLSIHEAIPGHCMQGVYNNNKSSDMIPTIFSNYSMIEGWANYVEDMMLENGWNNTPEMQLMFYKWKLRECYNAIIDYGIHCLSYSEEEVRNQLIKDAFQEESQVKEKYNRAKISQVQLCSYFTGAMEISAARDEYKKKMGNKYSLKQFHESFLSYGSAPVKFIKEMILSQ